MYMVWRSLLPRSFDISLIGLIDAKCHNVRAGQHGTATHMGPGRQHEMVARSIDYGRFTWTNRGSTKCVTIHNEQTPRPTGLATEVGGTYAIGLEPPTSSKSPVHFSPQMFQGALEWFVLLSKATFRKV